MPKRESGFSSPAITKFLRKYNSSSREKQIVEPEPKQVGLGYNGSIESEQIPELDIHQYTLEQRDILDNALKIADADGVEPTEKLKRYRIARNKFFGRSESKAEKYKK